MFLNHEMPDPLLVCNFYADGEKVFVDSLVLTIVLGQLIFEISEVLRKND